MQSGMLIRHRGQRFLALSLFPTRSAWVRSPRVGRNLNRRSGDLRADRSRRSPSAHPGAGEDRDLAAHRVASTAGSRSASRPEPSSTLRSRACGSSSTAAYRPKARPRWQKPCCGVAISVSCTCSWAMPSQAGPRRGGRGCLSTGARHRRRTRRPSTPPRRPRRQVQRSRSRPDACTRRWSSPETWSPRRWPP